MAAEQNRLALRFDENEAIAFQEFLEQLSPPEADVGADLGPDLMEEDDAAALTEVRTSTTDKFCQCWNMDTCQCGENSGAIEWGWDNSTKTSACEITRDGTEVKFHPNFSIGTACVRSTRPLRYGSQHYFEIKVLTPCFGTDIVIGVGTDKADMRKYEHHYASLLGSCKETWGLSYKGSVYHNEQWTEFHKGFGEGTIVGVHVDLWRGHVAYHINRKLAGVAFVNLHDPTVSYYPMVSSTAARSRLRLITATSYDTNLQYFCCNAIRHAVRDGKKFLPSLPLPPGLKLFLENNFNWLLVGIAAGKNNKRASNVSNVSDEASTSQRIENSFESVSRLAHVTNRLALIPILRSQLDDEDHEDVYEDTDAGESSGHSESTGFTSMNESSSIVEESDDEGPKPSKNPRLE